MESNKKTEIQDIMLSDILRFPMSLKIVAGLLILDGIRASIEMIKSLTQESFYFNLNVLGLFAGYGLLTLNREWRIFTLAALCFGMAVECGFFAYLLIFPEPLEIKIYGITFGYISLVISILIFFLLFLWMFRVLVRPDIRELFIGHSKK